jgi:hypothetical protein
MGDREAVELELLRYLREEAGERRDRQDRETRREQALERLTNQVTLMNTNLEVLKTEVHERFRGVESRISALETDIEDTGNFHVESLQRQLVTKQAEIDRANQQRHDSGVWWKRSAVGWIIAAAGTLVLAAGGVAWALFAMKFLKP